MAKSPSYELSWSYDGLRLLAIEDGTVSTTQGRARRMALVFKDNAPGNHMLQQDFFTKISPRYLLTIALMRPVPGAKKKV